MIARSAKGGESVTSAERRRQRIPGPGTAFPDGAPGAVRYDDRR